MSLRVHRAAAGPPPNALQALNPGEGVGPAPALGREADGWATRLAKLIPAEALGLYGASSGMIGPANDKVSPDQRMLWLQIIALVCLAFCAAIRLKGTAGDVGRPQIAAVAISLVSFVIWLAALGAPNSPIPLGGAPPFAPAVIALLWATIASYWYRGDSA